jgi:uncharacterized MAPEG superfamily protein
MTTELWLLLWSLPLYGLYLGAQSLFFRMDYGLIYTATARDEPRPESTRLGRAERALKNFQETWNVYIILALVAHLAVPGDPAVLWGAIVYLVGRVVYLPLYLLGTFGIRSLVWNIATLGLAAMIVGVLF